MRIFKPIAIMIAMSPLLLGVTGCASKMIGVHEGADRVSMADASQVGSCQSKGKTTVSVLAKVGFITRSVEDVEVNLTQMAINDAVDAGADTVVKGESPTFGSRAYTLYKLSLIHI